MTSAAYRQVIAAPPRATCSFLDKNANKESIPMTDQSSIYDKIGDEFARHWTVNHSKGEYGNGRKTKNTVEGVFDLYARNEGYLSALQRATLATLPHRFRVPLHQSRVA